MKSIMSKSLLVVALLAAGPVFAGCSEPAAIADVPNGSTASRDDMLAAQRAIKAYDTAVKAFTDCLAQSGDSASKGNDAVDKLQKVAAQFNAQLKVFKEKNGAG